MISVNQLTKRYDKLVALDQFSFDVKPGEIVGLLGPNGSGKTTAINCMLSLLTYDKGEIKIMGEDMTPTSYALKAQIGVVPQELALMPNLTVRENIDFFCGLYVKDRTRRRQLVDEAIDFVELRDHVKFQPAKLSGGLKRRLNIACGIAHKPRLIFLDEPTVAVDAQSRNFILEGIKKMREAGRTVVYTTHYLDEAEMLCDRIVIIDKGKSVATGTVDELQDMISSGEKITAEFPQITQEQLNRLSEMPNLISLDQVGNETVMVFRKHTHPLQELMHFIESESLAYNRIYALKPTLNEVFLALTGKELRD
ncbi:MAG: ABC transporter ATP-binding protein [Bacillota bacterium]|nr:ABC transporter ATP-binding protein [Bacillota bacterium]